MDYVKTVYDLSENFMKNPKFVFINQESVERMAEEIKSMEIKKFPPQKPKAPVYDLAYLELLAGAVNYCYWYGRHDVRPEGCSSTKMFELLEQAYQESVMISDETQRITNTTDRFSTLLAIHRFPLLEERLKHIKDTFRMRNALLNSDAFFAENLDGSMERLIRMFPGYASDMFLKRASLLFLLLYRKYGWFEKDIHKLHVPADYQVPKALRAEGCIRYSEELGSAVDNQKLIPKHSLEECEIRAATVIVCQQLVEKTGKNISDIDGYFWLRRKEYIAPFHLTITSDY